MRASQPKEEINEEDFSDGDSDIIDEDTKYQRIVIPNLDKLWLRLKPS